MCQLTDYNCHFISSSWQHNKNEEEFLKKNGPKCKICYSFMLYVCVYVLLSVFFICLTDEGQNGKKGNIYYRCISWTHTQHKMGHQTKFKTYIKINKHFQEIKTKKKKTLKYNTQTHSIWIFRERKQARERERHS